MSAPCTILCGDYPFGGLTLKIHRALLILVVLLFATGCTKMRTNWEPVTEGFSLDFRELTRDGFLLSPDAYTGPHDALGLVSITLQSGANLRPGKNGYLEWSAIEVSVDLALAQAKERAKALGADGISNLEIQTAPRVISTGRAGYLQAEVSGWQISGLAIRRRAP